MSPVKFVDPPADYGPVPFWFLSHHLEKDEISRQVREMKAQGMSGFFMHPRCGLLTPYNSAEWHEMIAHAVNEARRHGLRPWLYDEDPYPSGVAGGRVFWDHPEYTARMLSVRVETARAGAELRVLLPAGRPIAAFAFRLTGKPLTLQSERLDITDHLGIIRDREHSAFWPRSYYPTIEYHPHFRADMAKPRMALHWTPPEGRWKVFIFVDEPYRYDYSHLTYVDLMRPEVVNHFLRLTHDAYAERLGEDFGATIPGIFTDEPKVMGRYPWTGEFLARFRGLHGYDLRPLLPALCADLGPTTAKVRCDYRAAVLKLLKTAFFDQVSRWCDRHRLRLVGHVSPEEDPLSQSFYVSNLMPLLKSLHVPGTDLIIPRVGDRKNAALNLGPKLASSVAHQTGRERVLCETFAASGWSLTPADMRWITDWLYVLGVNMMVPHGLFYSVDGIRKIDAPPSLFFQQPWWEHAAVYSSYVSRLSYMLSGGRHVCEIALLYPMRTMWALLPSQEDEATRVRDFFIRINRTLLELQRDFDFLDEEDLISARVDGGAIRVGPESYRVLILPRCRAIHRASIERIEQFVARGGTVIAVAGLPDLTPEAGADPEWAGRFARLFSRGRGPLSTKTHGSGGRAIFISETRIFPSVLDQALSEAVPHDAVIESKLKRDLFVLHRQKGDRHIYFLVNTSPKPADDMKLSCPIAGAPQRWDPATGDTTALSCTRSGGRTSFALPLAARSSTLVIFDAREPAGSTAAKLGRTLLRWTLRGPWPMQREADNVLPLTRWEVRVPSVSSKWSVRPLERAFKLIPYQGEVLRLVFDTAPAADRMDPVVVQYRTRFRSKGVPSRVLLVGEWSTVRGRANVTVNSMPVKPFERRRVYDPMNLVIDITRFVRPGLNTLEVEISTDDPQGGLLEPLRVFGEFDVAWPTDAAVPTVVPAGRTKCGKPGSWAQAGWPFLSGTVSYRMTVDLGPRTAGERAILRLPKVAEVAEVIANGQSVAVLPWEPYEADLTAYLRPGTNELAIRVSNTAANLLEIQPKESGLLASPLLEIRSAGRKVHG